MTKFSRREMLWGSGLAMLAAALPRGRAARAAVTTTPKNFIYVLAYGGWDTSYALDPKLPGGGVDIPDGQIVQHGNLDIFEDPSRPNVSAFFERYASISAVVRGISLKGVSHQICMQGILTGARNETSPDLAAIVANTHSPELPVPYLVLGDTAFAGPYAASMGRVGPTNQLVGLLDPTQAYPVDGLTSTFAPTATDEDAIRAYQLARADRERAVRGATGYNQRRIDDFVASLDRGDRLRELSSNLGNRGAQLDLAGQRSLALDALGNGISRSVMISSQVFWDTHEINSQQATSHETLFGALTSLIGDLETRSGVEPGHTMLDETVVAVISEMGRTPKLNGAAGKDHWPVTSALVIGADIAGGKAYGGTTVNGEAEAIDFATGQPDAGGRKIEAKNFVAGLASACGLDPSVHFPEAEVFGAFVG